MTTESIVVGGIPKRFASVAEAASFAGLSGRTIRAMLSSRELTPFRPRPGRVVVDLRQLESVIRASARRRGTRGRHLHPERGSTERA